MAAGVNQHAIAVMGELGIDISGQKSKEIDGDLLRNMDVIVTLCGNAQESCPVTPREIRRIHWPVEDPVGATGTEEQILSEFRRARDEIRDRMEMLLKDFADSGETAYGQDLIR
jgi:arsenate reductase